MWPQQTGQYCQYLVQPQAPNLAPSYTKKLQTLASDSTPSPCSVPSQHSSQPFLHKDPRSHLRPDIQRLALSLICGFCGGEGVGRSAVANLGRTRLCLALHLLHRWHRVRDWRWRNGKRWPRFVESCCEAWGHHIPEARWGFLPRIALPCIESIWLRAYNGKLLGVRAPCSQIRSWQL